MAETEPQEKYQIQVLGKTCLKQAEEKKSQSNSEKEVDLQGCVTIALFKKNCTESRESRKQKYIGIIIAITSLPRNTMYLSFEQVLDKPN